MKRTYWQCLACTPVLIGLAGALGCAGGPATSGDGAGTPNGPTEDLRIAPIQPVEGRIVMVREDLRYVVIDFSARRMPAPGQLLHVTREDRKVGEVRVTTQKNQFLNGKVIADILEGQVQTGDRAGVE